MVKDGEKRIIEKIVQMAEEESGKIVSEAQKEADRIKKEAELTASSEAREIISRGTQEARREKQRILADARLKAKRMKMSMQEQLMQESFEQATKYLQLLFEKGENQEYNYADIITNFVSEAAEIIGDQSLELVFNERDRSRFEGKLSQIAENVTRALNRNVTLSIAEKGIPTLGGVSVKSLDGAVGVDNTIESRMSRFNEELKAEVTRILF